MEKLQLLYCKIPLMLPGHIYEQRTNLMVLSLGVLIDGRGVHLKGKTLQFAIC